MQFSGRAIFDNVRRLTHQSVRSYSVTLVSANPSFRSANCPYLSVCPVRFGVTVDPPIRSIGPSINLYPSIPCHPANCMHACVHACILIQSTYRFILPLAPASLRLAFVFSFLSRFIYLFCHSIYLPFRSRLPSFASRSHLDLTRRLDRLVERPIARPFNSFSTPARVPRASRGFPRSGDPLARTSLGRAARTRSGRRFARSRSRSNQRGGTQPS